MPIKAKKVDRVKLRALTVYRDGHLYRASGGPGWRQGQRLGWQRRDRYWQASFDGKTYYLHQLVWAWHNDCDADILNHINEDKSDNRIENLEPISNRDNVLYSMQPRELPVNVQERCGRFRCSWNQDGKTRNTSTWDTIEEALEERDQLKKRGPGPLLMSLKDHFLP